MTASTALITGASAGIGYELAKLFARDRYNLVLVARNRDTLEQLVTELQTQFGISAKAVALDLTAMSAPQLLFDQLQRDGVLVDILRIATRRSLDGLVAWHDRCPLALRALFDRATSASEFCS
jgi:short-subunit dehydrogenase